METSKKLIIGKNASIDAVINDCQDTNCMRTTVAQVVISPTDKPSKGKPLDNEVVSLTRDNCKFLVVHGKVMYNMCNPQPWMFKLMEWELREAHRLGADLVIHQGKNVKKMSNQEAINTYVKNVASVLEATQDIDNKIILENSARQGSEIGYSLSEIVEIYKLFEPEHQNRLGFCLDTCHTFVAGEIDMRDKACVRNALEKFTNEVGLDKVKSSLIIHLNDSNIEFGGRNDNHANFGVGFITNQLVGGSWNGIRELLIFASDLQIPMILETKDNVDVSDEIRILNYVANCKDEVVNPDIPKRYTGIIKAFKNYADQKRPDYKKNLSISTARPKDDGDITGSYKQLFHPVELITGRNDGTVKTVRKKIIKKKLKD